MWSDSIDPSSEAVSELGIENDELKVRRHLLSGGKPLTVAFSCAIRPGFVPRSSPIGRSGSTYWIT